MTETGLLQKADTNIESAQTAGEQPKSWRGNVNVFGSSSALQSCVNPEEHQDPVALVYVRNGLLANAGGRFSSKFLLNAIFACASKFSCRLEVLSDPRDPSTAGGRFFERCDELMSRAALRMVYNLGLHLNHKITLENAEEVEMYRRVFWGAFICDKLQSLYLGLPVAIRPRDAHENEPWAPYVDPICPSGSCQTPSIPYGPMHYNFYVVGATPIEAMASLEGIDAALNMWEANLPSPIQLDPSSGTSLGSHRAVPNILALHIISNAVIILLHRPLLAEGHLNLPSAAPAASWKRCTIAARSITNIAQEYRARYNLRSAPYLISYGIYVACTIHVRNAAAVGGRDSDHSTLLTWSIRCLKELSIPNLAVSHDGIDCPDLGPIDAGASLLQEADVENPGFPLPLSDEYVDGRDWDWSNWNGSFDGDVLYGFMGSHTNIPSNDGQHTS
ncbi:nitrogen assimilation transcription factor nirA [Trichoderma compactum]